MAYESTTVPIEKSQGDIRKVLGRHGAQRLSFTEGRGEDERDWVMLEFVHAGDFSKPHLIRMAVPLKVPDTETLKAKARRARTKTAYDFQQEAKEQESRRIWRVLFYNLKARMESVDEEVETFEQAWLPHIVDPASGVTLWDRIRPAVDSGRLAIGGAGLQLTDGKTT